MIQLPPPFANTPGLKPRGDQQIRRPRPRVGLVHADDRRARRYPPRRADPLGHRQGRRRRLRGRARAADRPRLRGRQDGRDRGRQRLSAHGRRPRGVGSRERPGARTAPGFCCAPAGARAPRTRPRSSTPASRDARRPGPTSRRSRWLATERGISGFGVETVGIDAGAADSFDPPFPVHNFLLGAGRLGLTQLANLDKLPITGALIVVSPLKLVGGTGSPSRVFAFVPKS